MTSTSPATVAPIRPSEAVLFDMDGVVTETARAHAAAWKRVFDEYLEARAKERNQPFRPFDEDRDYREFVDGKPRYEGVTSFLAARGIALPHGNEDDGPGQETVCGLGNRKHRHFHAWLEQNTVRTFPGALKLIGDLRQAAVKTALFSASRNAEAVLRSAGVRDLFDALVEGREAAELDLPGKPDPAMLIEAADRLGVSPGRAAVIEDATAGVEAAVRGGFGLVIGVDRTNNGDALRRAGAHVVVHHLGEVTFAPDKGLSVKTLPSLPLVRDREEEVRDLLSGRLLAVFLDYDGTLTPIVDDYTKAFLAEDMRAAVAELARHCTVAIVSGRGVDHLRQLVQLDSVYYAGSHGFEIAVPDGKSGRFEKGAEFLPLLDDAEQMLRDRLAGISRRAVERKRFSISVHYRGMADEDIARIEAVVDDVVSHSSGLQKGHGKKVFQIQPNIEWDKGHAVLWLLDRLDLDHPGVLPVYIGDDVTDEDAFRALVGRGLSVVVRDHESRTTGAEYAIADTADVKQFIEFITVIASGSHARAGGA